MPSRPSRPINGASSSTPDAINGGSSGTASVNRSSARREIGRPRPWSSVARSPPAAISTDDVSRRASRCGTKRAPDVAADAERQLAQLLLAAGVGLRAARLVLHAMQLAFEVAGAAAGLVGI